MGIQERERDRECQTACNVLYSMNSVRFFFKDLFILGAVVSLCCCVWAFSGCGEWGLLVVVVHRLLIAGASLGEEHKL